MLEGLVVGEPEGVWLFPRSCAGSVEEEGLPAVAL